MQDTRNGDIIVKDSSESNDFPFVALETTHFFQPVQKGRVGKAHMKVESSNLSWRQRTIF